MDDVNNYIDNNADNDNDNWIRDDHNNNNDDNVNHNSNVWFWDLLYIRF